MKKRILILFGILAVVLLMGASSTNQRVSPEGDFDQYYMMFCNECSWEWATECGAPPDDFCPDCLSSDVDFFENECGELIPDFMWIWQCDQGHSGKCEVNQEIYYCWEELKSHWPFYFNNYPTWRCIYCGYGEGYVTWTKVILDGGN